MAIGKPLPRYDVTFEWDSHQQGAMLATDKGKPLYMDNFTKPVLPQYIVDVASLASKPPDQEIPIIQKLFHGGFGQHLFEDATRYYSAEKADSRVKGNVILAPKVRRVCRHVKRYAAQTDISCNIETAAHAGYHHSELEDAYDPAFYVQETRAGTFYDDNFSALPGPFSQNSTYPWVRIRLWIARHAGAGKVYVMGNIDDLGSGSPWWSSVVEVTSSGEWVEFTWTTNPRTGAAWKRTEISGAHFGFAMKVDAGTTGRCYSMEAWVCHEYPSASSYWRHRHMFEWSLDDNTNYPLSPQGDFLIADGAWYSNDDNAFIAGAYEGSGSSMLQYNECIVRADSGANYWVTGDNWRSYYQFHHSDGDIHLLAKFQQYLWGSKIPNELRFSDDPWPAAPGPGYWSLITLIGDASSKITEMLVFQECLIVGKEDTAYKVTQAHDVIDIFMDFQLTRHPDNFKRMRSFKGKLYMPVMNNSLYEYDGTSVKDISPKNYAPTQVEYGGQIIDMACDGEWLYLLLDNASDTATDPPLLIAGREEFIDGVLDWHWHPLITLDMQMAQAMVVTQRGSDDDNLELWIMGIHTDHIGRCYDVITLPRWSSAPWQDGNCEFQTSGSIITSWFSTDFENMEKMMFYFMLFAENLNNVSGNERSITVEWQFEGEDWEVLHKFNDPDLSYEKVDFPQGKRGIMVRFKFTLATDDDDYTPRLEQFICACRLGSVDLRQFDFFIKATERSSLKGGIGEGDTFKELMDAIYQIKERNAPFYFYDPFGEKHLVTMMSPTPERVPVEEEDGKWEAAIHVQLMEVGQ